MWYDPIKNPPPENTDVLVYTDMNKMKVARLYRGIWDTYMKIIGWQELPKDKPSLKGENNNTENPIKRRGRPKKER